MNTVTSPANIGNKRNNLSGLAAILSNKNRRGDDTELSFPRLSSLEPDNLLIQHDELLLCYHVLMIVPQNIETDIAPGPSRKAVSASRWYSPSLNVL